MLVAIEGCWKDTKSNRALPRLLITDREWYSEVKIKWARKRFPGYIEDLANRCTRKTYEEGHQYFGLEFFGMYAALFLTGDAQWL